MDRMDAIPSCPEYRRELFLVSVRKPGGDGRVLVL